MGIRRFFKESIAVYANAPAATFPYDNVWTGITGSPFKGSATELSGDKMMIGPGPDNIASMMFCLDTHVAIVRTHMVKWNSRSFEVMDVKKIPEKTGHHLEVYCREASGVSL